ncbi:MAG: phosphoribosyl-ATP diphosphatase [Alphaproteobacteria bacterium]|jgi:phosphoribosyl-ATP pyrophosphohydrolase|nr:phosphoribosyl-ATP diphosphatase [Alphaproteobacteria bacterium]HJN21256.1 phosphoribosyl-ATP diphosphatase [Alphaproteobacteria bacterium]
MADTADVLARLQEAIKARKGGDPETSYVAKRFGQGRAKIAQKVGEEAVECAIAAVSSDREAVVAESADLLFHLMILWADAGIAPDDVLEELARRESVSGVTEKESRKP